MEYGNHRRISDSFHRKRVGTNQVMLLKSDSKYKYSNSQLYKTEWSLRNSELDGK
jgi:hypothetical protein